VIAGLESGVEHVVRGGLYVVGAIDWNAVIGSGVRFAYLEGKGETSRNG
jgi:hypothetical protein